jgi:hypothetical protein
MVHSLSDLSIQLPMIRIVQSERKEPPSATLEIEHALKTDKPYPIENWGLAALTGGVNTTRHGRTMLWRPFHEVTGNDGWQKKMNTPCYLVAVGPGLKNKSNRNTYYAIVEGADLKTANRALFRIPLSQMSSCTGRIEDDATVKRLEGLFHDQPIPANVQAPAAKPPQENSRRLSPRHGRKPGAPPLSQLEPQTPLADLRRNSSAAKTQAPFFPLPTATPPGFELDMELDLPPAGIEGLPASTSSEVKTMDTSKEENEALKKEIAVLKARNTVLRDQTNLLKSQNAKEDKRYCLPRSLGSVHNVATLFQLQTG